MIQIERKNVSEVFVEDHSDLLPQGKIACLTLFAMLFRRLMTDPVDRALRTLIVDGYKAYKAATPKNMDVLDLHSWIFQRTCELQTLAETTKKIDRGFVFNMAEMLRFFGLKGISLALSTYCGHLWDEPMSINKGNKAFKTYVKNHLDGKTDKEIAQHLCNFHKTTVDTIPEPQDAELVGV